MAASIELDELVTAGLVSVAVRGSHTSITSIHLFGESEQPMPGALVAAVGATDSRAQTDVVTLAAASDAGAVVLRGVSPAARSRCAEEDVTLVELAHGVDWSHLIWLVRSLMDRGAVARGPENAAQQGLFAIADAFAALLDAPVTIEDSHSRVVAYSATTDGADPTRTSTIMSRMVPPDVLRRLRASGVLKRLAHDDRPFTVPELEPGFRQRLVVPLRVGGQPVGSVWAIWEGDLDTQLEKQLTVTGTAAAMSLVQLNASANLAGRYSLEAIRAALRGDTAKSASGFELPFHSVRVVALERLPNANPTEDKEIWRTFLRKKSWPDPTLADVDGLTFAITPQRGGTGGWAWLRDLAGRSSPGRIAASRTLTDPADLATARLDATEALAAVISLGRFAAAYEDVWDTVVVRRACAAVATVSHDQLRELLREKPLAETLRVWLECSGDIRAAAAVLHMHPNTVRHRLKKIDGLVGDSVQTSSQRLAALLLLRSWGDGT